VLLWKWHRGIFIYPQTSVWNFIYKIGELVEWGTSKFVECFVEAHEDSNFAQKNTDWRDFPYRQSVGVFTLNSIKA
jgi:hypothetical protein